MQVTTQLNALQLNHIHVFLIILGPVDEKVIEELEIQIPNERKLLLNLSTSYLSARAFFNSYSIVSPILRFIRKNNIEAVVAHAPYAHFIMRLVKLVSLLSGVKFKLLQYFHGIQYVEHPVNSVARFGMNSLNQVLALWLDDAHISVSYAVKHDIESNLIRLRRHEVIYNSVYGSSKLSSENQVVWERISALLQSKPNSYRIVLPNRLHHNKGQRFFIEVLALFIQENKVLPAELAVYMVGEGPGRAEIEAAIANHILLQPFVTLTGALPNPVLRRMIEVADLVVVPSFFEGFSFSALEALQAGAVLLTSDTGGLKEVVQNKVTGFTFKNKSRKDCLKVLSFIYSNKKAVLIDRNKIMKDLKNRFSAETHVRQLLDLINS